MGTGCLLNASPIATSTCIRPSMLPSKTEAQQPPQTLSQAESTKIPRFCRECLHVECAKVVIFCSKGDERERELMAANQIQGLLGTKEARICRIRLDPRLVQSLRSPCGSKTNFFATPESNSLYPRGASLRGRTVALTILAICKRSWRMACISWRLYLSTGVWPV